MEQIKTIITDDNGIITEEVYVNGELVKFDVYDELEEDEQCECPACEIIRDYAFIIAGLESSEEIEEALHDMLEELVEENDEEDEFDHFEQDYDFDEEYAECESDMYGEINQYYEIGYKDGYLDCLRVQKQALTNIIEEVTDTDEECGCDRCRAFYAR